MFGKTYEIEIQGNNPSKNSVNETVDNWETKGYVQGVIWQLSGSETYLSSKDTRIIKHRLMCDVTMEITEADRVYFKEQAYDIEVVNDVNNLGKRYQIDLKEVS